MFSWFKRLLSQKVNLCLFESSASMHHALDQRSSRRVQRPLEEWQSLPRNPLRSNSSMTTALLACSCDNRLQSFPVEGLIDCCRLLMSKSPYVLVTGDFNVHVNSTQAGQLTLEGNHNFPLQAALRQLVENTGLAVINIANGPAEPTHCFPNTQPRCIDLVLVSPALLPLCKLAVFPVFPHGHSMICHYHQCVSASVNGRS